MTSVEHARVDVTELDLFAQVVHFIMYLVIMKSRNQRPMSRKSIAFLLRDNCLMSQICRRITGAYSIAGKPID